MNTRLKLKICKNFCLQTGRSGELGAGDPTDRADDGVVPASPARDCAHR